MLVNHSIDDEVFVEGFIEDGVWKVVDKYASHAVGVFGEALRICHRLINCSVSRIEKPNTKTRLSILIPHHRIQQVLSSFRP